MTEDTDFQFVSQIMMVILFGVIFAFFLSRVLLSKYLRAVRRDMMRKTGEAPAQHGRQTHPASGPPPHPLRVVVEKSDRPGAASRNGIAAQAAAARNRAALVYFAGGLAFALSMTFVAMYVQGVFELSFQPQIFVFVLITHIWPAMVIVAMVYALTLQGWARAIAAYVAVCAMMLGFLLWYGARDWQVLAGTLGMCVVMNLPPTLLALAFMARRIRAVGPMVLTLCVAATLGFALAIGLAQLNEDYTRAVTQAGSALGLSGYGSFFAVALLGMTVSAFFGWLVALLIGRFYRNRAISDLSLPIDALMLFFTCLYAMINSGGKAHLVPLAFVPFLVFKAVTALGLRLIKPRDQVPPAKLLLLRVFSLGQRSEALFDRFTSLWRYVGPVRLIAGPDLAATTVEPHEFLSFLSGQLSRQFVSSAEVLEERLAGQADVRDPDGRFRVSDFYCHDNTWTMVLSKLAETSDAVLMDLRGFQKINKGCLYEINALMDLVPLNRVVLVADATTDRAFLEQSILDGWVQLAQSSPNRALADPSLCIFELDDYIRVPALVSTVADAARGT